ncbi:response regulator transcription factor [Candidatus Sumerlaeota bacterium]|nr:response regulator transcription factor [Candidatus Sumerlaeota bacterium]
MMNMTGSGLRESQVGILIVDDHAMLRDSLGRTLDQEIDITVLGKAENAEKAIELTLELNPTIILMDIDMPGMICFDAARRITSLQPKVKFIFLSSFSHDRFIESALAVGAKGYITKEEPAEVLIKAIRRVAKGQVYFSDSIWSRLAVGVDQIVLKDPSRTRTSTLTVRELEVLRYIACGLAKKEIASVMHVSVKTVNMHTANIMAKLGIHNRVELTRLAIREGIIKP